MPTQEQINAANVELQIANDNYAALADRYNRYNKIFESYANATPEAQERARGLMQSAMEDYNQLRQNMYAAEDRIHVAQNAVNNLNNQVATAQAAAQQQAAIYRQWGQRRREIPTTAEQPVTNVMANNPFAGYQKVPALNSQFVPNEDMLRMNWVYVQPATNYNIAPWTNVYWEGAVSSFNAPNTVQIVNKTPTLSQWYPIPLEVQNVRNSRGNEYLRGMKNLENMGYTVFNQKAYDKYGNVYNLRSNIF